MAKSKKSIRIGTVTEAKDHPVPEALDPGKMKALTPGRITAYQKKVLAHFTPYLEIPFFQSMSKLIAAGDADAMMLYAKVSKKIESKPGISVTTNVKQNADNDNRSIQPHGYFSIDQIARELEAGRNTRVGAAPTPVREGPETEDEE